MRRVVGFSGRMSHSTSPSNSALYALPSVILNGDYVLFVHLLAVHL